VDLGRREGAPLTIFEVGRERLALRRSAIVASGSAPLASLPAQLHLVQLLDRAQLPLVSMVAGLPGITDRSVCIGLDASEVQGALTAAFLGGSALQHRVRHGGVRAKLIHPTTAQPTTFAVSPRQAARAIVGRSALQCAEGVVGAWAARSKAPPQGRDIDLLSVASPSSRVAVLQDALRRRCSAAVGVLDERRAPLLVLRSGNFVAARLDFEAALAEVLLRRLADELALPAQALACVPSLRTPATIRGRLRAVLARLPRGIRIVSGAIPVLGHKCPLRCSHERER
jgi:hypothetical protein